MSEKAVRVKMLADEPHRLTDAHEWTLYRAGTEYELPERLAQVWIGLGIAEKVRAQVERTQDRSAPRVRRGETEE